MLNVFRTGIFCVRRLRIAAWQCVRTERRHTRHSRTDGSYTLRRKSGRSTRSAAARLGTVQIATEPRHGNFGRVARRLRLLTAIGHISHRAFVFMRTNTNRATKHGCNESERCKPFAHCSDELYLAPSLSVKHSSLLGSVLI